MKAFAKLFGGANSSGSPKETTPATSGSTVKPAEKGADVKLAKTATSSNALLTEEAGPSTKSGRSDQEIMSTTGYLWVKVVEAREVLDAASIASSTSSKTSQSGPYVVIEFEKNTWVSTEADVSSNSKSKQIQNEPVWNGEAKFDVSRLDSEVTVSVWRRLSHVAGQLSRGISASQSTLDTIDMEKAATEGEIFLGAVKIRPTFNSPKTNDNWYALNGMQWKDKVKGEIRVQTRYVPTQPKSLTPQDFDMLKVVGKGSFGKVLQVRKKDTGRIYAMKVLNKRDIVNRQEIGHTIAERHVLAECAKHPFLVGLKFAFQTPEKLYLISDFYRGGELFFHLQKEKMFSEERTRFYSAELALGLEYLHKYNIVYRDLKPENVLLDSSGHLAITDFGLCKENVKTGDTATTFCGTAEYLAPEVIRGEAYGKAVDWWSLGIMIYEMLTGIPPFYSENQNVMYKRILEKELILPDTVPLKAKSLIAGLLDRNPAKRFGAEEVKQHPFYAKLDWDKLYKRKIVPPFKPKIDSELDTSNFDPEFTKEQPTDATVPKSMDSQKKAIETASVLKQNQTQPFAQQQQHHSHPDEESNGMPLPSFIQREFKGFTYDVTKDRKGGIEAALQEDHEQMEGEK